MDLFSKQIMTDFDKILTYIKNLPTDDKIDFINSLKVKLHEVSPFSDEPVDCIIWVKNDVVDANDYNPNAVAPVEMKLLEHSIEADGYTQPIVTWMKNDDRYEVVDGFHRNKAGKENNNIRKRLNDYLPITIINSKRADRADRMAATIRHNRARGTHRVASMSEIVQELSRRFWTNEKISRELGMDADEVLRLKQITGLAELFKDKEFSQAWEFNDELQDNI